MMIRSRCPPAVVFDPNDFPNVDLTDVEEITVEIVGNGDFEFVLEAIITQSSGDGSSVFVTNVTQSGPAPSTVPEPGTLGLLASALIGFAAIRRRRK